MRTLLLMAVMVLEFTALHKFVPPGIWQGWQTKVSGLDLVAQFQQTQPPTHRNMVQPVKTGPDNFKSQAKSAYILDVSTGQVLLATNASQKLPVASISKILTALVIMESHTLDEIVTVGKLPSYPDDAQLLHLAEGQQFKLGELLNSALIESDNDAADALALHDAKTLPAFAAKMNRWCQKWGISGQYFANANGLSDQNVASAQSLAKIGRLAILNPDITRIIRTSEATITDQAGKTYGLKSTDELLPDGRFYGIKTGYTAAAGQSFLGLATVNGHQIITVVLNSPDRFLETKQMADWVQGNFSWQ